MGLYGAGVYGTDTYGSVPGGATPYNLRQNILGGWAPWLPANAVPWRSKCTSLYPVDEATWTWGSTPLAQLTDGMSRVIEARDHFLVQDVLNIQVADPLGLYLPGGSAETLLYPNALIGLQSVVTTAAGSLTLRPNVYRVTQALSADVDRYGVDVSATQAEDWLRAPLDQPFPDGPTPPLPDLIGGVVLSPLLYAFAIAVLHPGPLGSDTYAGVAASLLNLLTAGRLVVDDSVPSGPPVPDQTSVTFLKYWQDPLVGKTGYCSWRAILELLAQEVPFRLLYLDNGTVLMTDAAARRDSGYVASCDAAHGGDFPVPWEKAVRQENRPQFTEVDIWYHWLNDEHPPQPEYIRAAQVGSTHPLIPNIAPIARDENVILDFASVAALPNVAFNEGVFSVAAARLQNYLGAADAVTLTVDSACPPPFAWDEVGLWIPERKIAMRAAFVGANIPLNTQPASWSLQWRGPW